MTTTTTTIRFAQVLVALTVAGTSGLVAANVRSVRPSPAGDPPAVTLHDASSSPSAEAAAAAVRYAIATGVVVTDPDGTACPHDALNVSWEAPSGEYVRGAFIEPVGPAPTATTLGVSGILRCEGHQYAYVGFEAIRIDGDWQIIPVPDLGGDDEEGAGDEPGLPEVAIVGNDRPGHADPPSTAPPATRGLSLGAARSKEIVSRPLQSGAIEPYAAYDPQDTCSPTARPGVLAFRAMILEANPGSRSLGITRGCSGGSVSEHKEGRAWDWGVRMTDPEERAQAERVLASLFATDELGNTHAKARRLGIMYIIWNRRIWGSYRAAEGWRSYSGTNPHTDHVHFSFAWPGARKETSFWTGVAAEMPGSMEPRWEGGGSDWIRVSGGSGGGARGGQGDRGRGPGHPESDHARGPGGEHGVDRDESERWRERWEREREAREERWRERWERWEREHGGDGEDSDREERWHRPWERDRDVAPPDDDDETSPELDSDDPVLSDRDGSDRRSRRWGDDDDDAWITRGDRDRSDRWRDGRRGRGDGDRRRGSRRGRSR